MADFGNQGWSV